jgi:transcriptional regulator with XRE-family HTH domain
MAGRQSDKRAPTGDAAMGARIRAAREKEKLTQGELAAMVGSTQSLISQYETGYTAPPAAELAAIARAVAEDAGFLLTGTRGMPRELQTFHDAINRQLKKAALRRIKNLSELQRDQVISALGAILETLPEVPPPNRRRPHRP